MENNTIPLSILCICLFQLRYRSDNHCLHLKHSMYYNIYNDHFNLLLQTLETGAVESVIAIITKRASLQIMMMLQKKRVGKVHEAYQLRNTV
jgi:hypothetical protein